MFIYTFYFLKYILNEINCNFLRDNFLLNFYQIIIELIFQIYTLLGKIGKILKYVLMIMHFMWSSEEIIASETYYVSDKHLS